MQLYQETETTMQLYQETVPELVFSQRFDPAAELITFLNGTTCSRGALAERVLAIATGLVHAGCRLGDRILLMTGNRIEFLETSLACGLAGGIVVPVNPELTGRLLSRTLERTAPSLAVCESAAVEPLLAAGALTASQIYVVDVGPHPGDCRPYAELGADTQTHTDFPAISAATPYCIYSSSGTTGDSKGVTLAHGALLSMGRTGIAVLNMQPDDVVFTCMPLFHANAFAVMFLGALQSGARTVVSPRFSVSRFWGDIERSAATKTSLLGSAGTLLVKTIDDPTQHNTTLRSIALVPRPTRTVDLAERFGVAVTEFYGSTEAGLPLAMPHGSERVGSCGRVLPDWQCELVDELDNPVPTGQTGELVVRPHRSWTTALGYWGEAEQTVELWRNQWIHTGDLMRQDNDGWFFYVDRKKDAIRVSGENVSSAEIEGVLAELPELAELAVYGVPSDLGEQDIMVAAVLRPGVEIAAEALAEHCAGSLPYYAVPRYVEFVESLPRTPTEKVRKAALRERGVTSLTSDLGRRRRPPRP
jgi:carnitine-CoA ligase